MNRPVLCPYCGSIENHGNICDWCHNPITDEYIITTESEDKKMKIKLEIIDLSPEAALAIMKCAASHGADENASAPDQINAPFVSAPAPVVNSAPVVPVSSPAVPVAPVAPVQPAPAVPVQPAPAAPVQAAPAILPTAAKQYTADELAVAARPICEIPGGREKLLDLLHSFTYTDKTGAQKTVQSIMDMPPEQYPALANGIRALGGRI